MNPDNPPLPPEDLEVRLTALVLGELPAEEAAALERLAAADPALAQGLARLRQTVGFVREAALQPPASDTAAAPQPRLSNDRREALLRRFKVVPVPAFTAPRRRVLPWFIPMSAAAGLVILFALLLTDSPGALLSEVDPRNLFFSMASAKSKSAVSWGREAAAPTGLPAGRMVFADGAEAGAGKAENRVNVVVAPAASIAPATPTMPAALPVPENAPVLGEALAITAADSAVEATPEVVRLQAVESATKSETANQARPGVVRELSEQVVANGAAPLERFMITGTRMTNAPRDESRLLRRYGLAPTPAPGKAAVVEEERLARKVENLDALSLNRGEADARGGRANGAGAGFGGAGVTRGFGGFGGGGGGGNAMLAGTEAVPGQANAIFGEKDRAKIVADRSAGAPAALGTEAAELPVLVAPSTAAVPFAVPVEGYTRSAPKAGTDPAPLAQQLRFASRAQEAEGRIGTTPLAAANAAPASAAGQPADAKEYFGYGLQKVAGNATTASPAPAPAAAPPVLGDLPALGRLFQTTERGAVPASPGVRSVNTVGYLDVQQPPRWGEAPSAGRASRAEALFDFDSDATHWAAKVPAEAKVAEVRKGLILQAASDQNGRDTAGKAITAAAGDTLARERLAETKLRSELLAKKKVAEPEPAPAPAARQPAPEPQPEVETTQNAFSTFSLNVADVSFKLAGASLDQGALPSPANIRSEEFLNAFNYRDPEPVRGAPIALAWERAQYPFAHHREAIRFSVQTAARGRGAAQPLNVVLLLDNSGSMERADRVQIIREALTVLARQLKPQDRVSIVSFARNARLWADGVPGDQAPQAFARVAELTPEGGTNLEDALRLAYATATRHFVNPGLNRVVLLTDGAANLGEVNPETLKQQVVDNRRKGVALDCFGIGWEGYNDDLLEVLSSNGDGRYGFVNTPEEAASELAGQLAGALQVAANDVKVQVVFNPQRVPRWRQVGYARHQLTQQQFRDNTVDAAELGAAEAGNALYLAEVNPQGEGNLGTVYVRYREPGTDNYRELSWPLDYRGAAPALEQSSPAMRLAVTAGAFAEWLSTSPFAAEVTPERLLANLRGVPEQFAPDARPQKLEAMIRQAQSIQGK